MRNYAQKQWRALAARSAASAPSEEGAGAPKGYKGATEGEITRGCCLHRGADEHGVKKRSFAFSFVYIYCFRTYSVYLSLRLPAQILYAGIHLPPQREARALPRRAQNCTEEPRLAPSRHLFAPLPFSAHASACAILAFADGGSRNSSLHPPLEALGISTRRGE